MSMVKIKQNLSPNNNHFWGVNPCNYITIHETANKSKGANAEMHAQYINNGSKDTWHYTVDDTQAIQHYIDTRQCWHAGDGSGKGNTESIGIEICVNSDGDYLKAVQNAVELVSELMKKHNIPIGNVKQHNHWSGKNCPTQLRNGSKGINWNQFIEKVKKESKSETNNLHHVQVGAFRSLNNAKKLKDELVKKGYKDAFIN